jgi:hypothetical protein
LLQGSDADLGTRTIATRLDSWDQPGRAAGTVKRNPLESKDKCPEATGPPSR